jgi:peptide deformylase
MTLRKIARLGHPVLLARAEPIDDPTTAEIRRLIEDMLDTMRDARGIGLAAPQVHESLRLIVVQEPAVGEDGSRAAPIVLVNPVLSPIGDERAEAFEGCLSIPELRGLVPRWQCVAWSGLDPEGRPIQGVAEGLLARVLQHEVDHLDGILYPMRMTDLRQLAFDRELELLQAWRAGEGRTA